METDAVQRKAELGGPTVEDVLFVEKLWLDRQKKRPGKENEATWPGGDLSKSKLKVIPLFKVWPAVLKTHVLTLFDKETKPDMSPLKPVGMSKTTFATRNFRYTGNASEGNRFIKNADL
jgi:hypothetical protein